MCDKKDKIIKLKQKTDEQYCSTDEQYRPLEISQLGQLSLSSFRGR